MDPSQCKAAEQGEGAYTGAYLNPFEVLNYPPRSLTEWDDTEYRRAKKRLMAELALSNGRLPRMANHSTWAQHRYTNWVTHRNANDVKNGVKLPAGGVYRFVQVWQSFFPSP